MRTEIYLTEVELRKVVAEAFKCELSNVEVKEMSGDRGFPYIGAVITKNSEVLDDKNSETT